MFITNLWVINLTIIRKKKFSPDLLRHNNNDDNDDDDDDDDSFVISIHWVAAIWNEKNRMRQRQRIVFKQKKSHASTSGSLLAKATVHTTQYIPFTRGLYTISSCRLYYIYVSFSSRRAERIVHREL